MKRIFPEFAYSDAPRLGCWWDDTVDLPMHPTLSEDIRCDVVVVGAGFTGVSAALHLARRGANVVVLDAHQVGWGASGRNGGFCCLGGSMRSDASLDKTYGKKARLEWRRTERVAVEDVERVIEELSLNVDRHSDGETCLAHSPSALAALNEDAKEVLDNYGVAPEILSASDLVNAGMAGPFSGGVTVPIGFGLNPQKLIAGIVAACEELGVTFFGRCPATKITSGFVTTPNGCVTASHVILATNGYASDDIPPWLAARYMPAQSTVLVTRPLETAELEAQGWTSDQMAYDTRQLLHYFRLLPERRFLFGMRGGLRSGAAAEMSARDAVVRDFRKLFPHWQNVDITHSWSGMVCLARKRIPFVGYVPELPGVLAGFAYHGNGVAMGLLAGSIMADLVSGIEPRNYPMILQHPPSRFPLGRCRRVLMPPIYASMKVLDSLR